MKFFDTNIPYTGLTATSACINLVDTATIRRIGNKINSKFFTISFYVRFNSLRANGWNDDALPPSHIRYRLAVIRQRMAGNTIALLPDNSTQFGLTTSIDSKQWDVQFDRNYSYRTGAYSSFSNSLLARETLNPGGIQSPPKRFTFKIPMKVTMDFPANTLAYTFDKNIFIVMWVEGNAPNDYEYIESSRPLYVDSISCKHYYTDV